MHALYFLKAGGSRWLAFRVREIQKGPTVHTLRVPSAAFPSLWHSGPEMWAPSGVDETKVKLAKGKQAAKVRVRRDKDRGKPSPCLAVPCNAGACCGVQVG